MNSTTRCELVDRLYKDPRFGALTTNRERIDYVLQNIYSWDQFTASIRVNIDWAKKRSNKSLPLAKCYKTEADLYLQHAFTGAVSDRSENLQNSLEGYHSALLHTPPNEVELKSRIYFRCAQIHLDRKEYDEALYAIDYAVEYRALAKSKVAIAKQDQTQTPFESVEELNKFGLKMEYLAIRLNCLCKLGRVREALELIDHALKYHRKILQPNNNSNNSGNSAQQQQQQQQESSTKISNTSLVTENELLLIKQTLQSSNSSTLTVANNVTATETPSSSSSSSSSTDGFFSYRLDPRCQIERSPIVGRHFIAIEDIPEGAVLLEEKPYSIIVETEYMHRKCNSCYIELQHRFFPCLHCTDLVFCTRACYYQALNTFHKHECGMVHVLKAITSPSFHVFRMVSRVSPLVAYELEQNKKSYSIDDYLAESRQQTVPELDKTTEERGRAYKMSSILWDHDEKHGLHSNVHHTVIGIETTVLLDMVHHFRAKRLKDNKSDEQEFLLSFIEMIVIDTRRIIFNVFGWHEYNEDWTLRGHVANCQCLVGSLINHSCVPNTNWEFHNGSIRFVTNQKIAKGEEITITYGPNKDISYYKRQERLNHYYFACNCVVCRADALKGPNLRCANCNIGPVVYGGAQNIEPWLNGKCLFCYQKQNNFEQSVQRLTSIKEQLRQLATLAPLSPASDLFLARVTELAKELVQLGLTSSRSIERHLWLCSNAIEQQGTMMESMMTFSERLKIAQFFDDNLPPVESIKGDESADNSNDKVIATLKFWIDSLRRWIAYEREVSPTKTNANEEEINKASAILSHFNQRLIRCIASFDAYNIVSSATEEVSCQQTLKQVIDEQLALLVEVNVDDSCSSGGSNNHVGGALESALTTVVC